MNHRMSIDTLHNRWCKSDISCCIWQWIWALHRCIWFFCQYWSVSTHLAMALDIRQNVLPAIAQAIFQSEIWLY